MQSSVVLERKKNNKNLTWLVSLSDISWCFFKSPLFGSAQVPYPTGYCPPPSPLLPATADDDVFVFKSCFVEWLPADVNTIAPSLLVRITSLSVSVVSTYPHWRFLESIFIWWWTSNSKTTITISSRSRCNHQFGISKVATTRGC